MIPTEASAENDRVAPTGSHRLGRTDGSLEPRDNGGSAGQGLAKPGRVAIMSFAGGVTRKESAMILCSPRMAVALGAPFAATSARPSALVDRAGLGGVARALIVLLAVLPWVSAPAAAADDARACPALLDHTLPVLGRSREVDLCDYAGQVVLLVNTASQCGYTPQFTGLEAVWQRYRDAGLVVLGFPSADFGGQEYSEASRTEQVCRVNYGVSFPMFSRLKAAAGRADPLYRGLGEAAGEYPRWNFHKYLVGRDGTLLGSFRSGVEPEAPELVGAIEQALASPVSSRPASMRSAAAGH